MKRPPKGFGQLDIGRALAGWNFEAGQLNVRLINGEDGKPKVQLRLDLGLLQMELTGRPDGKRPHRSPTELDFQLRKLNLHQRQFGTDAGFALSQRDCQSLREESAMFYHRYLSLFVLEQYDAVIRDTQHNLNVLDICGKYGRNDFDKYCLEQYRPYIMMMNTRAKACAALKDGYVQTALAYLRGGMKQILRLVPKEHRRQAAKESNEIKILLDMLRQVRKQLPPDPRQILAKRLKDAVRTEKFEEAAQLRDQLQALHVTHPMMKTMGEGQQPLAEPMIKPRKRRASKKRPDEAGG